MFGNWLLGLDSEPLAPSEARSCASRRTARRAKPRKRFGSPYWTISATGSSGQREVRGPIDMRSTCAHAGDMSKMVQVRNVPDALHRKLKARAAHSGQTLSDYLLAELERLATRPTREEMLARI